MSNTDQNQKLDPEVAVELGNLLYQLSSSKEGRRDIARAIKKVAPDSRHAAAFKDVEIEDRFEELAKKDEERRIADQQAEIVRQMNAKRQRLIAGDASGRKYSEDDVKKIETLMQQKGIVDYDDGAVLYAATLPPPEPKPPQDLPPQHGATWEIPEWETFGKDPVKASRDRAHAMIGEFMRKRG